VKVFNFKITVLIRPP